MEAIKNGSYEPQLAPTEATDLDHKDNNILESLTEKNEEQNIIDTPTVESEETTNEQENPYFDEYLIDLSEEIPEPEPIFSLHGIPVFTRGNISCISGAAKSRKTFLTALISAQLLKTANSVKIIIFDTEQSKFHVQKTPKRIHGLLEWNERQNNKQLRAFALRELNTKKRYEFITNAIRYYKPDLVFIDGIRDLVYDFNSPIESSNIVNEIMKVSSKLNCHICTVLHVNKGNKETTLRGHLGTEIQNKSESVLLIEKNGKFCKVRPAFCRNIEFEEFYFTVNEKGLPEYCNPKDVPKNSDVLISIFNDMFSTVPTLSYTDLCSQIMEKCKKSKATAERYLKDAVKQSVIIKNDLTGLYRLADINSNAEEED